eukprot:2147315-Rhodomonas_salina.1
MAGLSTETFIRVGHSKQTWKGVPTATWRTNTAFVQYQTFCSTHTSRSTRREIKDNPVQIKDNPGTKCTEIVGICI